MNILPKKSWHVRNKDNIERVRRDEEKAAQEEKERQRKIALAESEARTNFLRAKGKGLLAHSVEEQGKDVVPAQKNINFFQDLEDGEKEKTTNAEYEKEKKEEKEKYEKSIGLLTYLGQSSAESQTVKPWYQTPVEGGMKLHAQTNKLASEEFDKKSKLSNDPMRMMMKYMTVKKKTEENAKGITSAQHYQKMDTHMEHKALEYMKRHKLAAKLAEGSIVIKKKLKHKDRKKKKNTYKTRDSDSSGDSDSDTKSSKKKHKKSKHKSKKSKSHKERKHKHSKRSKKTRKRKRSTSSLSSDDDAYINKSAGDSRKRKRSSSAGSSDNNKHKRRRMNSSSSDSSRSSSSKHGKMANVSKSGKTIQQLRAERLRREQEERKKSELLLAKFRGEKVPEKETVNESESDRKYNNQFNPDFVRKRKRKPFPSP